MAKFTDLFISNLKPKEQRYDVREGNGEGFAIRVSTNGTKTWTIIFKFNRRKRRLTLGTYPAMTLKEARSTFREARDLIDKGIDPIEHQKELEHKEEEEQQRLEKAAKKEAQKLTVGSLADEYLEKWSKPRKRSWKEDQRILDHDILPEWKNRKAETITRRDVIAILDKIVDRGAPIAANRTFALIRKMFNFAIGRGILDNSPCTGIQAPAAENRRDRVLNQDEIRNFWKGLDNAFMADNTKLALKLQLVTAQRNGEIINSVWNEFDVDNGWWVIPAEKSKNKLTHRVPLPPLALKILEQAKFLAADSPWVFPSPRGNKPMTETAMGHAVRRNLANWEIASFTPHDLRRTAASHMTSFGISRLVVSKILNHVESGITAVYDRHSYDPEKKHALEAWSTKLISITEENQTSENVIAFG